MFQSDDREFFCYLLLQLKLRRLISTLTSGVGRKALRRCPDLSRKRDGIVVSALSFLPPPLVRELIKELLFMVVRRICGSRSAFTTRPPPQAASPGRGVMPTAYPAHTKVVSSRRAAGAVENYKSEISPEVNAGFLPRKEWKEKA